MNETDRGSQGMTPPAVTGKPGPDESGLQGAHVPLPPDPAAIARARKSWQRRNLLRSLLNGAIGALIVLLLLPVLFGVNPIDMVRGDLANGGKTSSSSGKAIKVVSPSGGGLSVTEIADDVTPAIVNIDVRTAPQGYGYFNYGGEEGTGSGVIYSDDGYIITNNHVVKDADKITVTLASGESLQAELVGTDATNDIAVIKIDSDGLPAIRIGDSDSAVVGQLVVAIGSPFGYEQTVTSGIISALNRSVSASSGDYSADNTLLTNLIQTDAAINPGNSGGALVDGMGRLIGINAVIATSSGGSEGIGFAIPVNTVKDIVDTLIAGEPVSHPFIGINGQTVTESIAELYDLPTDNGAYVVSVLSGSGADKAGLTGGDIIVGVNGNSVKTMDALVSEIRKLKVGDKARITFYRVSSKKTVNVEIQEQPVSAP